MVVSLYFLALLFPRDDDIACVATNIDHIAKVAVGVLIVVTLLLLMAVGDALVSECPFLVEQVMTFLEIPHCRLLL